jgi:uncharacterized protein
MATTPSDRIVTLDLIRGIAVMGIFSVNVVGMAMREAAYFNPPAYGFYSLADHIMWALNFVLIDGKMRSLFSILFGASMLLVIDRARAKGRSGSRTHLARMAALLLLGAVHFYLIWWGDILFTYAVVGGGALIFTSLPPRLLLLISALLFAYDTAPRALSISSYFTAFDRAHAHGASGAEIAAWGDRAAFFQPTHAKIAAEKAMHRSPYHHLMATTGSRRSAPLRMVQELWAETLALMLLGMAGFRSGFLTGQWKERSYVGVALVGLGVGGLAFAALAYWVIQSGFRLPELIAAYFTLSAPFRPLMAMGYAALIVLLFRRAGTARDRIAAVGRAAFTNYLGASLIGVLVFFDTGLGLYEDLSRAQSWLLVPIVWAVMLAWSKPWLDRFSYGPFEWLWRSLATLKLQPMRRTPAAV